MKIKNYMRPVNTAMRGLETCSNCTCLSVSVINPPCTHVVCVECVRGQTFYLPKLAAKGMFVCQQCGDKTELPPSYHEIASAMRDAAGPWGRYKPVRSTSVRTSMDGLVKPLPTEGQRTVTPNSPLSPTFGRLVGINHLPPVTHTFKTTTSVTRGNVSPPVIRTLSPPLHRVSHIQAAQPEENDKEKEVEEKIRKMEAQAIAKELERQKEWLKEEEERQKAWFREEEERAKKRQQEDEAQHARHAQWLLEDEQRQRRLRLEDDERQQRLAALEAERKERDRKENEERLRREKEREAMEREAREHKERLARERSLREAEEKEAREKLEREEAARKERIEKEETARKERMDREEKEAKQKLEREEAARKERIEKEEAARKEKLEREVASRMERLEKEEREAKEKIVREEAARKERMDKEETARKERMDREEREARERLEKEAKEREREDAIRRERLDKEEASRKERIEKEEAARKEKLDKEEAARTARLKQEEDARREKVEREAKEREREEAAWREKKEKEMREREKDEAARREKIEKEIREKEKEADERRAKLERERLVFEQEERERRDRFERERAEREKEDRLRRDKIDKEEKERREKLDREEKERRDKWLREEKEEKERLEKERALRMKEDEDRRARADQEAKEKFERDAAERQRLELEWRRKLDEEKAERDRHEKERMERLDYERKKWEQERELAERRDKERYEAERAERKRLEAAEIERLRAEQAEIAKKAQEEIEKLEKARIDFEKMEQERLQKLREEQDRILAEKELARKLIELVKTSRTPKTETEKGNKKVNSFRNLVQANYSANDRKQLDLPSISIMSTSLQTINSNSKHFQSIPHACRSTRTSLKTLKTRGELAEADTPDLPSEPVPKQRLPLKTELAYMSKELQLDRFDGECNIEDIGDQDLQADQTYTYSGYPSKFQYDGYRPCNTDRRESVGCSSAERETQMYWEKIKENAAKQRETSKKHFLIEEKRNSSKSNSTKHNKSFKSKTQSVEGLLKITKAGGKKELLENMLANSDSGKSPFYREQPVFDNITDPKLCKSTGFRENFYKTKSIIKVGMENHSPICRTADESFAKKTYDGGTTRTKERTSSKDTKPQASVKSLYGTVGRLDYRASRRTTISSCGHHQTPCCSNYGVQMSLGTHCCHCFLIRSDLRNSNQKYNAALVTLNAGSVLRSLIKESHCEENH